MPRRGRPAVRDDDKRLKKNRDAALVAAGLEPPAPPPKTRMQQLIDGDISVKDLDDEEIRRGRCRGLDGTFGGRPRGLLPRVLLDSLRAEYQTRAQERWEEMGYVARKTLMEIANNPRASADARVKAALAIAERAEGKVTDKQVVQVEVKPFERDLAGLMVDVADETVDQDGNIIPINRKAV